MAAVLNRPEKKIKTMTGLEFGLVGLAAVAGGAVNALAGGGTLITFPMLVALGVPPVASNVTDTVALCPGLMRLKHTGSGHHLACI
jgi:uncharacterized membrane protein YfcA